jgi:hypothetical protein
MIRRRSVITGICSLAAVPSAVTSLLTMPVRTTSRSNVDRTVEPGAARVAFEIHGWNQNDLYCTEKSGQHVVVIHLTNSWRSSWL